MPKPNRQSRAGVVGLGATAGMLLAATLIPLGAAPPASAKGIGPVISTVSTAPGGTDGDGGAGGKGGAPGSPGGLPGLPGAHGQPGSAG